MPDLDRVANEFLAIQSERGLRRAVRRVEPIDGRTVKIDGRVVINLGSNNYLGLSGHPEVIEAAATALKTHGGGSTGARLTSGTNHNHIELEADIAEWKGAEAALLFTSGYACALGTIPAIVGPQDLILSDELNHACLIDGARLSRATIRVFAHNDMSQLQSLLVDRSRFRHTLVVTEGVFSMDGDLSPLPAIVEICEAHDAWLMLDDAHGGGVLGPGGAGTAAHFGLTARVPIQMGTLSKSLGFEGGFIAGSRPLIDMLVNKARSFIFNTSAPASTIAGARKALALCQAEEERREALYINGSLLRDGLKSAGYEVPTGISPIIPVIVGGAEETVQLSSRLMDRGIWAPAIRPPTVPDGKARLRMSLTADHTVDDIKRIIAAMKSERATND
jgi:8-amino-7-oxononanoate synthase